MESECAGWKQQQNTRLPEVFPSWYSTTLCEILKTNSNYKIDLKKLPDYGGAGINLKLAEDPQYSQCIDNVHVTSAKSEKCRNKLSASNCALPFLPPNKIPSLHEPCLKKLKDIQNRQSAFVNKMFHLKKKMKSKQNEKLSDVVHDLHKKLEGNIQEFNISYDLPACIVKAVNMMPTSFINNVHVSDGNWLYTGGNLSYLPMERGPVLLHAGGKKFNSLVMTPVVRSSENARHVFSAVLQDQQTLKLNGKNIYQVSARSLENKGFCCVRQHKKCELLSITNSSEVLNATVLDVFHSEEPLCCSQMSPYIPGEYVVITSSGRVVLNHLNHNQPLWTKSELSKLHSQDGEPWWWCDFGLHPRSLVVADRKVISVLDARISNSTPLVIFNAVDNRSLLFDENVMVMQQHPQEVHQHFVATSFHLLVIDERVPSLPVLLWKHCLNTKPCYSSVVSLVSEQSRGELIVLLGSQEGAQTSVFHLRTSGCNTVQPQSLSPPWYLSQPEDMVKLFKVQGLCSNHTVQQRLQAPLTGVCSIPHPDSSGFTAFQLTSFCDLFFQDFYADTVSEDKTYNASAGCPLTTPSPVIDECNRWMKSAKVKDHSDIQKAKLFKRVDFTEEFMVLKERKPRAKGCLYCVGSLDTELEETVDLTVCPSCGLDVDQSKRILEEDTLGGSLGEVSVEEALAEIEKVDFSLPMNFLSKKILSVWQNNDSSVHSNDIENSFAEEDFHYGSQVANSQSSSSRPRHHTTTSPHQMSTSFSSDALVGEYEQFHSTPKVLPSQISATVSLGTIIGESEEQLSTPNNMSELSLNTNKRQFGSPERSQTQMEEDDVIPPSQECRETVGETVRKSFNSLSKTKISKKSSTAGF